ncbi:hypothetical protein ACLOJK_016412 [Asimina triloba]
MANRSLFLLIRRCDFDTPRSCNDLRFRCLHRPLSHSLSSSSSIFSRLKQSSSTNASGYDDLKRTILRLRSSNQSVRETLEQWAGQGSKLKLLELRGVAIDLKKLKRHKQALEDLGEKIAAVGEFGPFRCSDVIFLWLEAQGIFRLSATDHAILLELMIKVHGLSKAEEYFETIPYRNSQKRLGLIVDPHPFNEMMKLYMATGHFGKVPLVIERMKHNRIPLNVLSFNLWIRACGEMLDVAAAERVHKEMVNEKTLEVGWSTYSTLANIYIRSNFFEKATAALRAAEQRLSASNRLGYFFLITQHATLYNRDGVLRLWELSKAVPGKMTCANYMSMISCLVKLDDFVSAERIFRTWELACRKYDIRVPNILLGAYMRKGWMDKVASLHQHTLEKGGCPNYKTWEILMEGWVKIGQMDKAVATMKQAFLKLSECHWQPPPEVVMAIAEHLENQGGIENACSFAKVLRHSNLVNLSVYKLLLRMHIRAQVPVFGVLKMMERDKIMLDEEASALIRCTRQFIKVTPSGASSDTPETPDARHINTSTWLMNPTVDRTNIWIFLTKELFSKLTREILLMLLSFEGNLAFAGKHRTSEKPYPCSGAWIKLLAAFY